MGMIKIITARVLAYSFDSDPSPFLARFVCFKEETKGEPVKMK